MPTPETDPDDVALSLTLAVVTASPSPLLLLDGGLVVVAASMSFVEAFCADATKLEGESWSALCGGSWDMPELQRLLEATVLGEAQIDNCELNLRLPQQPVRHVIVHARRLDYLDLDQTRVLVALSDVTDARADAAAKDQEASRNIILLQEVRHRVANSLQIIASILMQNARKTPSDETRGHLMDAHHRVMSVAALERLLAASEEGDVEVHAYFTSLCNSISASMIGEAGEVTLTVDGGHAIINARASVSLGLIITELVINAVKHAFPAGRSGRISVNYDFHGPNWILCVRDDGVGMPAVAPTRTGLGTSIVLALAKQLNASFTTEPERPGTKVTIEHSQIALVHEGRKAEPQPRAKANAQPAAIRRLGNEDRS